MKRIILSLLASIAFITTAAIAAPTPEDKTDWSTITQTPSGVVFTFTVQPETVKMVVSDGTRLWISRVEAIRAQGEKKDTIVINAVVSGCDVVPEPAGIIVFLDDEGDLLPNTREYEWKLSNLKAAQVNAFDNIAALVCLAGSKTKTKKKLGNIKNSEV